MLKAKQRQQRRGCREKEKRASQKQQNIETLQIAFFLFCYSFAMRRDVVLLL